MSEQQTTGKRPFAKVWGCEGRGVFFKVIDGMNTNPDWRKISFEIFKYEPKPNVSVHHSIDFDDFLYLAHLIEKRLIRPAEGDGQQGDTNYTSRDVMQCMSKIPGFMAPGEGGRSTLTTEARGFLTGLNAGGKWSEWPQETFAKVVTALDERLGASSNSSGMEMKVATIITPGSVTGFDDFKGGPDKRGKYSTGFESRILRIKAYPATDGSNGLSYVVTIDNGPGIQTANGTGAVKPASGIEGKQSLSFVLKERDALKMCLVVKQYMDAYMSYYFDTIRIAHDEWNSPKKKQSAPEQSVSAEVATPQAEEPPVDYYQYGERF